MTSRYIETPDNYNEISSYLITDINQIKTLFYEYDVKCFYDTCSLQHHSNLSDKSIILNFLLNRCGLIIISRTVLMELSGEEHRVQSRQLNFIKEMYEYGLKILLIDEEDALIITREAVDFSNEDSNYLLGYAIKQVMKSRKAVCNLVNSFPANLKAKLLGNNPVKTSLYKSFFSKARQNKVSGDSLAEELIFICLIVLTKVPLAKYIFLSDDLASTQTVIGLREYIKLYHEVDCPQMLTTPKITEIMVKENICNERLALMDILNCASNGQVPVLCIDEYDLDVVHKSFDKNEFLNKLEDINFKVIA